MKDISRRVYFAKCIGPTGEPIGAYKIGCSYGYNDRIKNATVCLPFTLEVVATVPGSLIMEAACHLWLREHRIGGEYFRASPPVEAFAERAATHGSPFARIEDNGFDHPKGALFAPFMAYHGVTPADVCAYLKRPKSTFDAMKEGRKSRHIVAAAAIIAAKRGQHVHWPQDLIYALGGEVYHSIREPDDEGEGIEPKPQDPAPSEPIPVPASGVLSP